MASVTPFEFNPQGGSESSIEEMGCLALAKKAARGRAGRNRVHSSEMRKIIQLNMNCFYAAVEMRERPELAVQPIAVGGGGTAYPPRKANAFTQVEKELTL
jgi:hypothetical protein